MKKRILLPLIIFLVAIFALVAFADGETTDAVWQIESEDGSISYSYDFFGGLSGAKSGDKLTLIPDYIELDRIFTLSTGAKFVVDFGDSKIVYPNNTITAPVFVISANTDLTILSSGASVFLQDNVRSYISVSNARLTVLGDGFSVYAPDAIDAGGNAYVEIHNVYFMKNSGNMMGLLCARGSSKVYAYNSTFVSKSGGNAVYSCETGRMELYNCSVISLDMTMAAQVSGNSVMYAENSVFSAGIRNENSGLTLGNGCYATSAQTYKIPTGAEKIACKATARIPITVFVAPSSFEETTAAECSFTSYVIKSGERSDSRIDESVWKVKNGDTVYYTDSFFDPILHSTKGDELTLLRDTNIDFIPSTKIAASSIDLGAQSLSFATRAGFSAEFGSALFGVSSESFTLTASGVINGDFSLLSTDCPTVINLDGASITGLKSVADVKGELSVNGGAVRTTSVAFSTVGDCDVILSATAVMSDGVAVSSGRAVIVSASTVATLGESAVSALGTLSLLDNSYLFGDASVGSITATGAVYFSTTPSLNDSFLYKKLADPVTLEQPFDLTFGYSAADFDSELFLSVVMDVAPKIRVYVPDYVFLSDSTRLVIAVNGITYSPAANDASEMELNGEDYLVFSFAHVYMTDIEKTAFVRITVGSVEYYYEFSFLDLLVASCNDEASDSFKRAAAAYVDLAFDASGIKNDELSELFAPYLEYNEPPVPTAPEYLDSVFFDVENRCMLIKATDGVALKRAVIKWGGESLVVRAEDGVIRLPWHRLDPTCKITLSYIAGSDVVEDEIGILSLYSLVHDSPSRSSALFEKYISYLILLHKG